MQRSLKALSALLTYPSTDLQQAAAEIGLSEVTVKVHRHNLMKKLGAKSVAELVRIADSLGIGRR